MTQIHFTLDSNELQELISNSGADQASVLILVLCQENGQLKLRVIL